MKFNQQKLCLHFLLTLMATYVSAQESWPTPEVEQMYHHAQEYMARGDLNDAVITYKEVIALAPDKIVLYKELGNALYLSGKFEAVEETLAPVCTKEAADATCYRLLAASQAALYNRKKAITTLQSGLVRFPLSGLLYHEQGKIYTLEDKREDALNAWLDGIAKDPEYAPNYYEASLSYLNTDKVMWGLLYGEMYLDMLHDTTGDENIKDKLFAGYKTLFEGFVTEEAPQYGKPKNEKPAKNFEEAVMQVYSKLTPVISDGISTENLTMVRTRFLMDWFSGYNSKYPFSLFSYQDTLVSYGRFDIWNEWIFGKAESVPEYDAWNTFHDGAITRTKSWQSEHLLHPVVEDGYNDRDRDRDGLFEEKKNSKN
jgi:hypothetical protein